MDLIANPCPANSAQSSYNQFWNDSQMEMTSWEYHSISVTRVSGFGFGIAVSGGRDNPHFANGDPSIAVSDVLKGGPAEDRLQVNDRILSVNGVTLQNVEYATAVQVLRDSGNTVNLAIKRRVANTPTVNQSSLPTNQPELSSGGATNLELNSAALDQPVNVVLNKGSKKENFGIILGCHLFIKEILPKARDQLLANGYTLQVGDLITRIQNTNCSDSMSLKEAKKIIDGCKERLNLTVVHDHRSQANNYQLGSLNNATTHNHGHPNLNCHNVDDSFTSSTNYTSQNLYVQPPTRNPIFGENEKNNLTPRGRLRGPLVDESLSDLEPFRASTGNSEKKIHPNLEENLQRTLSTGADFYSTRQRCYEDDPLQRSKQSAEPRFISFQKEGSVGIRLTGGNEVGIFVTAVQPGSPASLQGLAPGDKIHKVNDMNMHGVTREEAVLFLLSLQDRIDLIVQHCKEEYEETVSNQRGDSFHIKTHFHCETPSKGEIAFRAGDIFHVLDTLFNGVVGSWQVLKVFKDQRETQRGVIPNKSRAEELATAQFNATKKEINASESRGNFFRRRRPTHRRSKSLSRENWDDVVFSDSISKFPAYERVVLRHPGFIRPVVFFGSISDIAREKLLKDFPDKFTVPLQDNDKSNAKCRIVRLSNIRDIMDRGKHALLDITPDAVDRLNYAQFYPIVIFLKADSKHIIKQLRHGLPKAAHKSSKKLFEQSQKIEKIWSHILSSTIFLTDTESWYKKLRETVDLLQGSAVWMSESKPVESFSDDFLFPMTTSRLSYASSPESDLELSPGPPASLALGNLPQLVKSNSDPSIVTNQDNLDRDRDIGEGIPPPYMQSYDNAATSGGKTRLDDKYSFISNNQFSVPSLHDTSVYRTQSIYGVSAPDLPPRIDRASKPPPNALYRSNLSPREAMGRTLQEGNCVNSPFEDTPGEYLEEINKDIEKTGSSSDTQLKNMLMPTTTTARSLSGNQNSSYDSVSSYDSFNATQLSVQKLGPNAPDDLKSVPKSNIRHLPLSPNTNSTDNKSIPNEIPVNNKNAAQDYSRGVYEQNTLIPPIGNDLNGQNTANKPSHSIYSSRNIAEFGVPLNPSESPRKRPTNIGVNASPRKHFLETKTDYGKYSRNNTAPQVELKKSPSNDASVMSPSGNYGSNAGNGVPFKPIPPPKPKNYRPPVNNQPNSFASWDNGEHTSSRSPNACFYSKIPSYPHHSQLTSNSSSNMAAHSYQHFVNGGQLPPSAYNNNNQAYEGGQYVHRVYNSTSIPQGHTPDRYALDLAGNREQRGSAFELYRKPQIAQSGHHHNMREFELFEHCYGPVQNSQNVFFAKDTNANDSTQIYRTDISVSKTNKKSTFKSQLIAVKNALLRTTRPLRRNFSMTETKKQPKPCLKRQLSLMERKVISPNLFESSRNPDYSQIYVQNDNSVFNRNEINQCCDESFHIDTHGRQMLYEDLENFRHAGKRGSVRLVRRHSMADRSDSHSLYGASKSCDSRDIYQTSKGAYLLQPRRHPSEMAHVGGYYNPHNMNEPIYQTRREMHRNHLQQSQREMRERIAQGKQEIWKEFSEKTNSPSKIYDQKLSQLTTDTLDKTTYQSKKSSECMTEPIYISKQEFSRPKTILESPEEIITVYASNETDERKEEACENNSSTNIKYTDESQKVLQNKCIDKSSKIDQSINNTSIKYRQNFPVSTTAQDNQSALPACFVSHSSIFSGPPIASSTPCASANSLSNAQTVKTNNFPLVLKEQSTSKGIFDETGGTLYNNSWDVSLHIPPGAIPAGIKQEIYFTVTDPRMSEKAMGPPLDMENGETMLSPLVMCGPQGLNFLIPVTLNIPHCAGRTHSLGLTLKATDSETTLHTNWDNIDLPSNSAAHTVSVEVDHF